MKDDMLAEIDDLLLEVSSSNIKHKVWNSLFAGWEDLDEYNVDRSLLVVSDSLADRNNVGGWQYKGVCDCPCVYTLSEFTSQPPVVRECYPAIENVDVPFHVLFFESHYTNFITVLWHELYVGPCEVRHDYHTQQERILEDGIYRNQIWYSPEVAQVFTPEEQDRIIELLMSFEVER